MIANRAEPFYFPGNSTGCLLIHGFTGAPTEMRPLGEYLADKGFTVMSVRLAGHGTKIADMQRSHWQDWSASVMDGWHLINSVTESVFLIGLSMGGALALHHASFLPVKGVVGLSTPYRIERDLRLTLLPILARFIPYISKGKSDRQNPNSVDDHFSYDMYPTKGILEFTRLLKEMHGSLPKVSVPALLMHSKRDSRVLPENMEWIYRTLGTEDSKKRKIWVENSGHVITRDLDKLIVFESVATFIQEVLDSNQ